MNQKMKILITGASGYVGSMLVEHFLNCPEVDMIVGIDKDRSEHLPAVSDKFKFIQKSLIDDWENDLKEIESDFSPSVVIHTAWQIREMYGQKKKQSSWNIGGSNKVFNYAFGCKSVKKIIHFSTVASYSARKDNQIDQVFTEKDPFRESDYLYASEKALAEDNLHKMSLHKSGHQPQIFVVRPVAITGPKGRFLNVRLGLQSVLAGKLKDSQSFWYRFLNKITGVMPITKKWVRQFVHEDDVVGIVSLLALQNSESKYEVFNLAPPGDVVTGSEMARALGKKSIQIPPWIIRIVFFCMWHLSRGKIPTSKGGWRTYSYPIVVDGSKITQKYGHQYFMNSFDSFTKIEGKYAKFVDQNKS